VTGKQTCGFWAELGADSFTYNAANLISVNLASTPLQVVAEDWVKVVDVDDYTSDGGLSQIGPSFCEGAYSGALYLSQRIWSTAFNKDPKLSKIQWPPFKNTQDFQYQCAVYSPGPGLPPMRYHGFLATVASRNANQLLVYITEVGKSQPVGPFWVAMDSSTDVDLPANGLTTITLSSPVGSTGPLFLSMNRVGQFGLHLPKVPARGGDDGVTT
jgi:hypothetical protein